MNTVELNKFKILFPASFDELKKRDLLFLGKRFPYNFTIELYTEFFVHLCNFNKRKKFAIWFVKHMDKTAIETVLFPRYSERIIFDFLLETPIAKNIAIKNFRHHFIHYTSYASGFKDMSIGVFSLAETYFKKAIKNPESEALDKLIACLYRPIWRKLCFQTDYMLSGRMDRRAAQLKSLPEELKKAILLQYIATREHVIANNKTCFQKPDPKGNIFKTKNTGTWLDALYELSEHVTKFKATSQMNLWVVLRHLSLQIQKDNNMRAEMDRIRNKK